MKFKIEILNYDSEWVVYCIAGTIHQKDSVLMDLELLHNFKPFQIRCTTI